jgi:hypothetical protein
VEQLSPLLDGSGGSGGDRIAMDGAAPGATGNISYVEGKGTGRKPPPKQSLSAAPSRVKLDAVGRATRLRATDPTMTDVEYRSG